MRIICMEAVENGAHANQFTSDSVAVPEGWALIPDGMELPATFPFVGVTAVDGTVTELTPGNVPEPEPAPEPDNTPTLEQRVTACETDITQIITGLEALGT